MNPTPPSEPPPPGEWQGVKATPPAEPDGFFRREIDVSAPTAASLIREIERAINSSFAAAFRAGPRPGATVIVGAIQDGGFMGLRVWKARLTVAAGPRTSQGSPAKTDWTDYSLTPIVISGMSTEEAGRLVVERLTATRPEWKPEDGTDHLPRVKMQGDSIVMRGHTGEWVLIEAEHTHAEVERLREDLRAEQEALVRSGGERERLRNLMQDRFARIDDLEQQLSKASETISELSNRVEPDLSHYGDRELHALRRRIDFLLKIGAPAADDDTDWAAAPVPADLWQDWHDAALDDTDLTRLMERELERRKADAEPWRTLDADDPDVEWVPVELRSVVVDGEMWHDWQEMDYTTADIPKAMKQYLSGEVERLREDLRGLRQQVATRVRALKHANEGLIAIEGGDMNATVRMAGEIRRLWVDEGFPGPAPIIACLPEGAHVRTLTPLELAHLGLQRHDLPWAELVHPKVGEIWKTGKGERFTIVYVGDMMEGGHSEDAITIVFIDTFTEHAIDGPVTHGIGAMKTVHWPSFVGAVWPTKEP